MKAAAVPALLVGGILAAQSWPTFYAAYQDGLDARKRGDHALAVRAFTRAIALEPQPGRRVKTYGLNFLSEYYPYLRLAESALALGDLAAAESALDQSQRRGGEPAEARAALMERLQRARQPAPAPPAPTPGAAPVPAPEMKAPVPAPAAVQAPVQPAAAPMPAPASAPVAPPPSPAPAAAARPLPTPASRAQAAAGPGQPVQAAAPVTVAVAAPVAAPTASAAPAPVPAPAAPARGGHGWWGLAAVPAALLAAAGVLLRRRRRAVPPTSAPTVTGAGAVPAGGPPEPAEGRSYGPYIAKHVLGRGGCATAYYGVHRETGAEVAIKVPHPHLAGDEGFRARFRREASLGALLDHPRVVRIVDPGPAEGDLWLAMAFIRGTTLEAALKGGGAFPVDRAVGIAADIAEAMAYAHGKGVVHRDLKPGNVMLTDQGAVVMDFGIARKLDTSLTASTMFLGTPMYCAPEGLLGPKVGPPADRYSLGVILFEMLAGQPPFQADTVFQLMEAQRSQPLPDLGGIRPYTPPGLIRLVQRLCAKAPEDRPEDLEALAILQGLRT